MIKKLVIGLLKMMVGRKDTQANLPEDDPPPEFQPAQQDQGEPQPDPIPQPRMTRLFSVPDDGTCQAIMVNPLTDEHCRCGDPGAARIYIKPEQSDTEMRCMTACKGHARLLLENEDVARFKVEPLN